MFVKIFDTRRSPVGCNFISGRSESAREESSADDEGRTVPSSGNELFLSFASNLWPGPPYGDNVCLWPTDCDFDAWRHCQKGNKPASIANLRLRLRFLCLPTCSSKTNVFHVVPETHDTIFPVVLLRDTYVFLRVPNALDRQSRRILDFLEILLKHARKHEERKEDCDSSVNQDRYRVLRDNVSWPSHECDSLISR